MQTPNTPTERSCAKHRRPSPQGRRHLLTSRTGRHWVANVSWRTQLTRWCAGTAQRWRTYRDTYARPLARTWAAALAGAFTGAALRTRRGSVAAVLLLLLGLTPVAVTSSVGNDAGDAPVAAVPTTTPAEQLADRSDATDTASRSLPRSSGGGSDTGEVLQAMPEAYAVETSPAPDDGDEGDDGEDSEDGQDAGDGEGSDADDGEGDAQAASAESESGEIPAPVGGLNEQQMSHAATIVAVGRDMGMPERAWVVALATAMQESNLRVLANPNHPESFDLPNDGTGNDHDSVGIFQQRPASGWGTVEECMDPATSARKFYHALGEVSDWRDMAITEAAQAVQVSAFPDHYAKHEPLARELVGALN